VPYIVLPENVSDVIYINEARDTIRKVSSYRAAPYNVKV
jgi:hypothetical protein